MAWATKALAWQSEEQLENVHRFVTPECEVRMSVEYFGNSVAGAFRFRDSLTKTQAPLHRGRKPRGGIARHSFPALSP